MGVEKRVICLSLSGNQLTDLSRRVISLGYEEEFKQYRRIVQHAFNYTFSASSAVYSCPVSMTSGAGRLIGKQLPSLPDDHPFHELYRLITARQDNWISSQWMTERPGGSDVQNSETVAIYSPPPNKTGRYGSIEDGGYLVSGFKFFSSATDCDMAFMLAKTESGQLSLFVAPARKTVVVNGKKQQVTNGIRIHRLKTKMGTKELPTAELELDNVRAHLVGPLDRGIATIALLLNVTRTHNFITALSCWRRGMAIAKNFAKARSTMDQPLWTLPMHLRLLATMEVKHRGALQLAFFTTSLLSFVDNGFPHEGVRQNGYVPLPDSTEKTEIILRTLTATAKAVICKTGTLALQECQEAMGGVGYMDEPEEPEFNISRLMRDTAANMTWEGTTNVLSSEVVRHLLNKNGRHLGAFGEWVQQATSQIRDAELKSALDQAWREFGRTLDSKRDDVVSALAMGRQLMFSLAWIVSGVLLALDAERDGDAIAGEIARRWVLEGEGNVGEFHLPNIVKVRERAVAVKDRDRINWDCRLVWGMDLPEGAATGFRAPNVDRISAQL
ncbi:acyl-CoA dehydrogenase/oxidase C-terminal [Exophiala viscosa]|uniref:acyl-CoA dehydrogenase/oxidase C-terminal n=1 Tax=Exophiala viscosa TaxID=2486360 RepID=UPI00219D9F38|nr:acyl-CoA dehydrogenase/oxidase C-terminal [Exophiala viscosa]